MVWAVPAPRAVPFPLAQPSDLELLEWDQLVDVMGKE